MSSGKVEIMGGIINTAKFSVFCQFYNVRKALFDSYCGAGGNMVLNGFIYRDLLI